VAKELVPAAKEMEAGKVGVLKYCEPVDVKVSAGLL